MRNIAIAVEKGKVHTAVHLAFFLGVTSIAPLIHNQLVSGSLVNAALFSTTILLGFRAGMAVGLLPSFIAFSAGLLPASLALMIPFIMAGNALLVLSFAAFGERNYWLKMVASSTLKFVFLYGVSTLIFSVFFGGAIASTAARMMSWPQLLTALMGGFLAYGFVRSYRATGLID